MAERRKPVKVIQKWSIEGGHLVKPAGLETRDVVTGSGTMNFAKVDKNAYWLLKLFKSKKGGLRRSTLFDTIKQKLEEKVCGPQWRVASEEDLEDSPSSAVAEPAPDDPMNRLEDVGSART